MGLSARDLRLGHPGQPALLDGAALTLAPGQRLAIIGANGAGKTTLGRALAGHLAPAGGHILWQGRPWSDYSRAERAGTVQFIAQRPWLHLSGRAFTLREEIAFGPENLCLPRPQIAERTDTAMALLGLTHLADRDVRRLSGGETQRLAIASALAMRPRLLVLDEPMTDLDAEARAALCRHLRDLPWQMSAVFLDVALHGWLRDLTDQSLELRAAGLHPLASDPAPDPNPAPVPQPPLSRLGRTAIRIQRLSFAYPQAEALFTDASAELPMGSVTAILGPNGAGKSSLLRLLAGLERPGGGRIELAGLDPSRASPRMLAQAIGIGFQASDRYFVQPRVLDEVALAMRYQGVDRAEARSRAARTLARLGLAGQAGTHPMDLHAGARRLVAIASAIAHGPQVLMLDESQRGLDAQHLARLEGLIADEAARGAAVLIVTHDLGFMRRNASHVLTLNRGCMQVMPAAEYRAADEAIGPGRAGAPAPHSAPRPAAPLPP